MSEQPVQNKTEQKPAQSKVLTKQQQWQAKQVFSLYAQHELSEDEAKQRLDEIGVDKGKASTALADLHSRKKSLANVFLEIELNPGTLKPGNPAVIHAPGHGLTVGESVKLEGFESQPSVCGLRVVHIIDADNFAVSVHVTKVTKAEGVWCSAGL